MSYTNNSYTAVPVGFKVDRYGSTEITGAEYNRLKPFSSRYVVTIGKNDLIYDIVHTDAGYLSISKFSNCALAEWLADEFTIQSVVADNNEDHYADILHRGKQVRLPLDAFLPKSICTSLFKKNIAVKSNNKANEAFAEYIQILLQDYEAQDAKKILGWKIHNNTLTWQGANMEPPLLEYRNSFASESEYLVELNSITEGCPEMQFVLCTAAAATLLAYLSLLLGLPVDSFGLSLVGDSSTGKTTALRLAASLFGSPKSESLFSSFFGTTNALIEILSYHWGVPLCYDETTIEGNSSKADFVYSLSQGVSKLRMNKNMQLQDRVTWQCTCLFSSENRLVDLTEGDNKGTAGRILCLEGATYTRDSEHSQAIKTFANQNHGIIGKLLSEYLLNADPDMVQTWYQDAQEDLQGDNRLISCSLTDRLIGNHAMILCAAKTLQEIGMRIDAAALKSISVNIMNQVSEQVDAGKYLIQKIFSLINSEPNMRQGIYWDAMQDGTPLVCSITETSLSTLLKRCNVKDEKAAIKSIIKTRCIMKPDTDHNKTKLSIDNNICYAYRFDMQKVKEQFGAGEPINYTNKKIRRIYNQDIGALEEYEDDNAMIINPITFASKNMNHQFEGKLLLL